MTAPRLHAACSPGEVRVAVWDGHLRDYAIWRPGSPDGVGDVHRGRVMARVRALGGSFVALETGEGFLPDTERAGAASEGALIAVQVTRAAQGGKGPRLTARVSDPQASIGPVRLVRRGPGAVERLAAAYPDAPVLIDDPAVAARLHPGLGRRISLVAQAFDPAMEDRVAALEEEMVWLPGGGSLRIQPTAALVAIDVDAGGGLARGVGKTAAHAGFNAAALPELGRQIRLRGLSGAILIDFAGLSTRARAALAGPLQAALAETAPDCRLVGFTGLGLAELVRRRVHPPLHELVQGPAAAAARALRAAVGMAQPGHAPGALHGAPELIAAIEQDPTMRADLARSVIHRMSLRSDPSLSAGAWRLEGRTQPG